MALGLVLSDDLIFTSRISGTAQALGHSVQQARTLPLLARMSRESAPTCIFVDLGFPDLRVAELLAELPAVRPFVVAFGSHVDAAGLRAARQAGCDLVLPRSAFVEQLPTQLPHWLAGHAPSPTPNEI